MTPDFDPQDGLFPQWAVALGVVVFLLTTTAIVVAFLNL